MTEKDWNTFFALLSKIVNDQPGTWEEKRQAVFDAAAVYGEDAETCLEEFGGWIDSE